MKRVYSIVIILCLALINSAYAGQFVPSEQQESTTYYRWVPSEQTIAIGTPSAVLALYWLLAEKKAKSKLHNVSTIGNLFPIVAAARSINTQNTKTRLEKKENEANINKYRALVTWVSAHETINYAQSAHKAYQEGNTKECLINTGTAMALVDCTARNYTGGTITNKLEKSLYVAGIGYATYQQLAQAYAAYKDKNMRDAVKHAGIGVGLCIVGALPIIGTDYFIGKK